ncbi:MAG: NAD(P)/FAD-dependent oxidoreductase [Eubacterium sp.]|nr:NAD(P)/FAD-dependent oxidoreductase [Eubacterium sp.]
MDHNIQGYEYYDIVIVGAGASGTLSACLLACDELSVLVIEKEGRIGKKLSATGNGRCNLTNMDMSWKHYYGDREWIDKVIASVTPTRVRSVFEEIGVFTREKDGYVYPHSNQAATVVGALYREMKKRGVKLRLDSRVREVICFDHMTEDNVTDIIDIDNETGEVTGYPARFLVKTDDMEYSCNYLVMASGGAAGAEQGGSSYGYGLVRGLGHTVTDIYPGLTGMECAGRFWKDVAGTRIQGSFSLYVDGICEGKETGEIQITKTGVSGIPVFQLCRIAARALAADKPVWGEIDFVPGLDADELSDWIDSHGIDGLVPVKWINLLGRGMGKACVKALKHFEFTITDTYGIDKAQVSSGGVPTDEISPYTFGSRLHEGLYILGELVDIDGVCGGYNLHLAWSGAILAAGDILRS